MQASRERLEGVLGRARESLEKLDRELKSDTRKTHAHLREIRALVGAGKAAQYSNSLVRRHLAGDTSAAADVSSLRPAVDYFFGRRPPMDARGRALQQGVIDHRASGFSKPVRAMLVEEVLDSVKKRLWLHVKNTCGLDHSKAKRELERTKNLSNAELLDAAELANICLADPRCKVWEEVGQVMWKTNKKCSAECRLQFLNNDDPRLTAEAASSTPAAGTDTGTGTRKRPVACAKCSARKIKCIHQEGRKDEPKAGQPWDKRQAHRLAQMVDQKVLSLLSPRSSRYVGARAGRGARYALGGCTHKRTQTHKHGCHVLALSGA
jgi:hypothetical protein